MSNYTKLYHSLLTSSIWSEDDRTRLVWVTMLVMTNQHGEVEASIPGLAKMAGVPIADTEAALAKLMDPDPYSRTKEYEGRRIEEIDGGWVLLNHKKYRGIRDDDDRREQNRQAQARFRESKQSKPSSAKVSHDKPSSAHTDTDVHTNTDVPDPHTPKGVEAVEAVEVLMFLNAESGFSYRETETNLKFIRARLAEEGVTIEGVKQMISRQAKLWKWTDMEKYLRPETLFNKTKFDGYYATREAKVHETNKSNGGNPRNNFPQHKETAGDVLRMREERERARLAARAGATTAGV